MMPVIAKADFDPYAAIERKGSAVVAGALVEMYYEDMHAIV